MTYLSMIKTHNIANALDTFGDKNKNVFMNTTNVF